MSSHGSKTAVGAFVLGGIGLLVLAIVLLGGDNLFNDDAEFVLYFDGSVSGLSVGAPVVFRGVPLGSVTRISLVVRPGGFTTKPKNELTTEPVSSLVTIPVYIRIDKKSLMRSKGGEFSEEAQRMIVRRMVEEGLRARLQLQSMVTGQYRVELDFHPHSPLTYHSSTPELEIPTLPSPIDTLQRSLAKLPLEEIVHSFGDILNSFSRALADDKLKDGIAAFSASFVEIHKILVDSPLRSALDETAKTVQYEVPATLIILRQTMENFSKVANQLNLLTDSAQDVIAKNSPTMLEIRQLLKESTVAVRALRQLAEMLERNPEALIKGRQGKR